MDKLKLIFNAMLVYVVILSVCGLLAYLAPNLTRHIPSEYVTYIEPIIIVSVILGVPIFLFLRWTTLVLARHVPQ